MVSEFSERKNGQPTPESIMRRKLAEYAVEAAAIRIVAEADVSYLNDQPMDFEQLREVSAFITGLGREALRAEQRIA